MHEEAAGHCACASTQHFMCTRAWFSVLLAVLVCLQYPRVSAGLHMEGELAGVPIHRVPHSCCWSAQGPGGRMPAGRAVSRMSIPLMSSLMSNKVIIQMHMVFFGHGWKHSIQTGQMCTGCVVKEQWHDSSCSEGA